jgi:PIN domain nuclease of toxin-antitoxin system
MTSATPIEPIYVVDTNALIWYLTSDPKLNPQAMTIFMSAEKGITRLYLSSISIAEMYYADKKWGFFDDFGAVYRSIKEKSYFQIVDFRADDVLDFDRDISVPEMHDRIITGLAKRLNAPVITSDHSMRKSGLVRIEWAL